MIIAYLPPSLTVDSLATLWGYVSVFWPTTGPHFQLVKIPVFFGVKGKCPFICQIAAEPLPWVSSQDSISSQHYISSVY